MIHHLEEDVEHVRVRFLDLVEQQHRVRLLADRVGEQATLIEAHVTGRRADEPAYRVLLHVLRHVEADEGDAHDPPQLLRQLGLSHTRRTGKEEAADGLGG